MQTGKIVTTRRTRPAELLCTTVYRKLSEHLIDRQQTLTMQRRPVGMRDGEWKACVERGRKSLAYQSGE